MKSWDKLIKVIIFIAGVIVISFDALLYNSFETQKGQISAMAERQETESQINGNKLKDQQNQIYFLSKDLHNAQEQIKDQHDAFAQQKDAFDAQQDAFLQEVEKRQQIANESKGIQTSLIDIKAETDAMKQDMKGWQKDYVAVLANLEKKMDGSQAEIKSVEDNLVALDIPELKESINSLKSDIEKITHPSDNDLTSTTTAPQTNTEQDRVGSP